MSAPTIDVVTELATISRQLRTRSYLDYQRGITRLEVLDEAIPTGHPDRRLITDFFDELTVKHPSPRRHTDGYRIQPVIKQSA